MVFEEALQFLHGLALCATVGTELDTTGLAGNNSHLVFQKRCQQPFAQFIGKRGDGRKIRKDTGFRLSMLGCMIAGLLLGCPLRLGARTTAIGAHSGARLTSGLTTPLANARVCRCRHRARLASGIATPILQRLDRITRRRQFGGIRQPDQNHFCRRQR